LLLSSIVFLLFEDTKTTPNITQISRTNQSPTRQIATH